MELNPTINQLEVVATWKSENESDGTVFIARRTFSKDSPHCEFVVSRTYDGETWEHGEYFHSGDYGSEQKAKLAAMLRFLYRAGFTYYFSRLYDILQPWALRGVQDLGLVHTPDNPKSVGGRLYETVRAVLNDMSVGEVLSEEEVHRLRQIAGGAYHIEVSGRAATSNALNHTVKHSKGEWEWTTDNEERKAVIRLR